MRVNLWDGKTLSAWIVKTYGVQLGVRQCQRLFRQFEFRLRKPRPVLHRNRMYVLHYWPVALTFK